MAATSVGENADLLTNILLRLQVKPLMRFKCVSKQWLALITTPSFCHSHTLLQYHTSIHIFPSALMLTLDTLDPKFTFPVIPLESSEHTVMESNFNALEVPNTRIVVKRSCNGLLLVERNLHMIDPFDMPPGFDFITGEFTGEYFVCNPTTKQFCAITFPNQAFQVKILAVFLAFEPLRSSHFKVIAILSDTAESRFLSNAHEINVYSSETGCWSDNRNYFIAPYGMDVRSGVYFNGAIHWYSKAENSLYFDVESRCFKAYPMPSNNTNLFLEYFGESGGHLHMILDNPILAIHFGLDIFELDIFELEEDYSGWSRRFRVDLNPIRVAILFSHDDMKHILGSCVLCIVRQEKEENSMLVLFINGKVMFLNLVDYAFGELISFDQNFKRIKFKPEPMLSLVIAAFQYFENLSWVGEDSAAY